MSHEHDETEHLRLPSVSLSRWCHDVVGLVAAYQRTCEWRSRARSHHELMNLSDRILRDIGVSRRDVVF